MFHFLCSLLWEFEKGKPRLGPTLAGLSVLLVALTHADRSPGVPSSSHVLGRMPLMPLVFLGNSTKTIHTSLSPSAQQMQGGCADTSKEGQAGRGATAMS